MHKPYIIGTSRALRDLGLIKLSEDDPNLSEGEGAPQAQEGQNPAELLASLFQQADVPSVRQIPDNKTKPDKDDSPLLEKGTKWGPPSSHLPSPAVAGTAGFHLPGITAA